MKRTLILSLLFVFTNLHAVGVSDVAPNWSLQIGAGNNIDYYSDSNGHVSVLLFWATWCPYCKRLMPHLQEVADQFADAPVTFYALNIKEDGDPVKYLKDGGFSFILMKDADAVADDYGVYGTPGLMVVDKDHRIAYIRRSGESDEEVKATSINMIKRLLDQK